MSGRWARRLGRAGPTLAALALLAAGCAEPTAQLIQPTDSPISFEVPADYTRIGSDETEGAGVVYGLPDSTLDSLNSDPVIRVDTLSSGELASFAALRELSTFGEFDPLDQELEELPNNTEVLGYVEIIEPAIWGVRLQMAAGQEAADFQALVDRASGQVVVSRVVCTQACFVAQIELIDEMQGSWSLEP